MLICLVWQVVLLKFIFLNLLQKSKKATLKLLIKLLAKLQVFQLFAEEFALKKLNVNQNVLGESKVNLLVLED